MQKKLADYLKVLIDLRDNILHEFYEPGSLLLCDEAIVLIGLLTGLNVVDCNLCLKVYVFLSKIYICPIVLTMLLHIRKRISTLSKESLIFLCTYDQEVTT